MHSIREQLKSYGLGRAVFGAGPAAMTMRIIPVAALIAAVALLWPGDRSSEPQGSTAVELATVAGDAAPPAQDPSGGQTGVTIGAEDRARPRLFVQLDEDASGGVDQASDTTSGPTSTTVAEGESADPAANGESTTSSRRTTTTERAGTQSTTPTTVRSSSTRAPATSAPVTAAPTTKAPTTAAPTTAPPTTRPPTTAAPTTAGSGGTCSSNAEFERVFRDDFNGSSVAGHWSQYNSNGNSNYGLRRPSANSVSNGSLYITAKMENGKLVSGGMSHKFDQKYGKYVVRVRTDNDPSQAVSGVVLTWPQSGVHPRDGENNIYETLVKTPNRNPFYTFIHKPFGSKSDQEYYIHSADGSQFQTMTMEWTPQRITIIREGPGGASGRDVWTVNETSEDLIPDVAHHVAIQLDGWKHSISGPVRMQVDYVEIHKYCG